MIIVLHYDVELFFSDLKKCFVNLCENIGFGMFWTKSIKIPSLPMMALLWLTPKEEASCYVFA